MDLEKMKEHIKLCRKNLNSKKIKCCATCPFEEEIIKYDPTLLNKFKQKRTLLK